MATPLERPAAWVDTAAREDGKAMSDNRLQYGKLQQQYFRAQYEDKARNISSWGKTGTPKKYRRKTDWFGLIAAAIVIAAAALIIKFT